MMHRVFKSKIIKYFQGDLVYNNGRHKEKIKQIGFGMLKINKMIKVSIMIFQYIHKVIPIITVLKYGN